MKVCHEYLLLLEEAVSRKKQIKKTFVALKKHKEAKEMGNQIRKWHNEAFEAIDCLRCANCCSTISPMVTDNDIKKMAAQLRERPSEVVEKHLRLDEEGDYVFRQTPCPFLNTLDNKCSVYIARPKACRGYPHTDDSRVMHLLGITYKNTFVCPAVYLVVKNIERVIKP
jgi:uncharacterized protein